MRQHSGLDLGALTSTSGRLQFHGYAVARVSPSSRSFAFELPCRNPACREVATSTQGYFGPAVPRKEGWLGMQIEQATELVRHTLLLALIVSAPMLLIGLGVGILISLLQAVTQIQEQTLSFIPKIVAMVTAAIILMPWMGHRLMEYSIAMFGSGQLP
jgi:flagellar biosynthetic protein FliQ